jgi:hypothetical protein
MAGALSLIEPAPLWAPPPKSLLSINPLRWLTIFGPGAIVASLSIGTGELIFSSRGGAIFGYKVLFLFLVISILKWVLLFTSARHMILSGVHPLQRWMEIPIGPRGWLPSVMFVFAAVCIPIWVGFHCSVLGDLIAELSGSKAWLSGATVHLWGLVMLVMVSFAAFRGGYAALERVQLVIIGLMLGLVSLALILLKPDWLEMLYASLVPQRLYFPEWMLTDPRPSIESIVSKPVWIEMTLYVGVIGGAGFDYLAYVAFLREKAWGLAGSNGSNHATEILKGADLKELKQWIRAPLIDCTFSFLAVFLFSAVFVASGWLVLAPQHQIPGDGSFLSHQSQFVTQLHPWLFPLYVAGTLLTMFGTLYGTVEIAPTILGECCRLMAKENLASSSICRLRRFGLAWTIGAAALILVSSFTAQLLWAQDRPPGLTALLIPANLFTGVLSCGIICLLNPWMDRFLPAELRVGKLLAGLNGIAAVFFLALGIRGYWDYGGPAALLILAGTVLGGCGLAWLLRGRFAPPRDNR